MTNTLQKILLGTTITAASLGAATTYNALQEHFKSQQPAISSYERDNALDRKWENINKAGALLIVAAGIGAFYAANRKMNQELNELCRNSIRTIPVEYKIDNNHTTSLRDQSYTKPRKITYDGTIPTC